jgi:hypothetical protein
MFDYSYLNQAPWRGYSGEIEKVLINEGIAYLGDYTFNMPFKYGNIDIVIPESVIGIGEDALSSCLWLTVLENSYAYNWATELNEADANYEIWIKEPTIIEKLDMDKLNMDKKTLIVIVSAFFLFCLLGIVRHKKKKTVNK